MLILFDIYCFLLLMRFVVPFTGQMYFNPAYQALVKITGPVIKMTKHLSFNTSSRFVPLIGLLLVFIIKVFLKTVFHSGVPVGLIVVASFYELIGLIFKIYFLVLTLRCFRGFRLSFDNISRILKDMVEPFVLFGRRFSGNEKVISSIALGTLMGIFVLIVFIISTILMGIGSKVMPGLALLSFSTVNVFGEVIGALRIYSYIIFIRILLSWFGPSYGNNFLYAFVFNVTEPYLSIFKRARLIVGPIDFGPAAALLVLWFLISFLQGIINKLI